MLDRVKQRTQEGTSEMDGHSFTSMEKSLIRLFRHMPDHEQGRVIRVAEALALSGTYSPAWSVVEKV
jgi:hypothetical protein